MFLARSSRGQTEARQEIATVIPNEPPREEEHHGQDRYAAGEWSTALAIAQLDQSVRRHEEDGVR